MIAPRHWRDRLAWLPLAVGGLVVVGLWVANCETDHESRALMLALNIVFTGLVAAAIVVVAARGFLASGQLSLLLFGSGTLLWGLTTMVACGLVTGSVNCIITIHNTGIWGASLCHFSGLVWPGRVRRPGRWLAAVYGGVLVAVALLVGAALAGWTPVFFVQGHGGTPIRHLMLGAAIALLAGTAWVLLRWQRREPTTFAYYYGLGLAALAVGLWGIMMETVPGGLLSWAARSLQYLGGIYLCIAAVAAVRAPGQGLVSLAAMAGGWRVARLRRTDLSQSGWRQLWRYGGAVVAVVLAFWVRVAIIALAVTGLPPYITFYPAAMLVAVLAGVGPGLVTTGLAAVTTAYWILPPAGLAVGAPGDRLGLAVFAGMGAFISVFAEISQRHRRKAEAYDRDAALRASQARLATFATATFEGIIESDRGQIVDCNEQFAKMLGYTVTELWGVAIADLVVPENRAQVIENIRHNREVAAERGLIRKDGTQITVEVHGRPVAPGSSRRHTSVRDITAHKQAEADLRQLNLDLAATNAELRDAHAAALNLMQDAVAASQRAAQAVTDLGESEQRIQQALSISRSFTFEWRPATDQVLRSASCITILGLTAGENCNATGQNYFGRVHPDDRARFIERIGALTPAANSYTTEYRILRGDGGVVMLEETAVATFDAAGKLDRLVGVATDVTARKQAEAAVRASEARFRSVLDQSRDIIYRLNLQTGRYEYISPAAATLFGFSIAEFLAQDPATALAMIHPDDLPAMQAALTCLEATAQTEVEYRQQTKSGDYRWVSNYLSLIRDGAGRPLYRDGNLRDITARKQAAAELHDREEQLRLFAEHAPAAIAMFDTRMRYIVASQRWLVNFGLVGQNLLGRSHYEVFPEVPERWREIHRRCLAGAIERAEEDRFERADGRTQWVRWEIRPWHTAAGAVGGIVIFSEDITARKQAAESIRQSEERLARAQEIAHVGSWELELNGHRLTWSDEVYRIFGLQPQEFAATYEAFLERVHPEDRARVDAAYTGSLQENRDTYAVEHRIVRKNTGEIRVVQERCEHFRDGAGAIVRSLGMVQDITERKAAEEELRASEERYRLLFENLQDAFAHCQMVYDIAGQPVDFIYLDVNAAFERLTGLKNVVGKPVTEVVPGIKEIHPELLATYARVARTGQPERLELEFKPLARWLTLSIYSPHAGHFAVTFDDITARKRAEESLRESEERLQRAQAITHLGSWEIDLVQNRLTWSDEVFRIFGYRPQEFAPTRAAFLERVYPDDREKVAAAYISSLRKNHDTYEIEHLIVRHKTGEIRIVQERGHHVRDATGKIIRSAGMVHDITERKVAEEQVSAALAEKEVLLREIHHRVKNNLQVIASLISLQSDTVTDDRVRAVFDALGNRVRTMALVHEKLYQTKDLAQLDFASYAASLLYDLWQAYGVHGKVQLNLEIKPVALPIKTAMHCALILNELATNALKYAFPAGRSGAVTVAMDHDPAAGTLCLRVRDDGVGLPAGLDWRNTESLGMRLVKMLAGGTVEAGPGPGTEFRVTIPLIGG